MLTRVRSCGAKSAKELWSAAPRGILGIFSVEATGGLAAHSPMLEQAPKLAEVSYNFAAKVPCRSRTGKSALSTEPLRAVAHLHRRLRGSSLRGRRIMLVCSLFE